MILATSWLPVLRIGRPVLGCTRIAVGVMKSVMKIWTVELKHLTWEVFSANVWGRCQSVSCECPVLRRGGGVLD